jgi:hypothetical protein
MRMKTCATCGAPFPAAPRVQHCARHRGRVAAARATYQTAAWRRASAAAIAAAGHACELPSCASCYRLTAHHVEPKVSGGSDARLVVLCGPHHSQYEADVRHGRDTANRRQVERIAASR